MRAWRAPDKLKVTSLSWDVSIFQPKAALAHFLSWVMEDKPTKCEEKFKRVEMLSEDRRKLHSTVTLWPLQKKRLGCFWRCVRNNDYVKLEQHYTITSLIHLEPSSQQLLVSLEKEGPWQVQCCIHYCLIKGTASGITRGGQICKRADLQK